MKLKNFLIVVKDIERSRQFYHDLFGLNVLVDFDGKREEFFPEIAKALKSCLKPGDNVEIAKADFKLLKAAEKLAKPVYKKP